MLNVFTLANGRLFQEEIEDPAALAHVQPIWVDLEAPTAEEKGWITGRFGLTIPSDAVDDDLEESARFYEEDNGELHIRSDFLIEGDDAPGSSPAATCAWPSSCARTCCSRSTPRTCRCSACCACARAASRR
jgi:Mg2+ and Co2+ transporter CorA